MINLSLNELKLTAQYRNISDYENKSKENFIKALSKPKPKPEINKKKLEEIRKEFYKLPHKFSKKEADKYRKVFYDIKNYRHLSESEIEEIRKNFNELEKSLMFKKFHSDINSVDYNDLDNYDNNYDFADDDECRKIGSIRILFKEFDRDYYKPIRIDSDFAWRNNNYIDYVSKGDRYENISPQEYLNMIRPYLRDLINEHRPTMELNNNNNDDNNNDNDNNNDRAEWKIPSTMQNSCISTKCFEETRTIYTKSEPLEIFVVSNTEDVTDKLLIHFYKDFNEHK